MSTRSKTDSIPVAFKWEGSTDARPKAEEPTAAPVNAMAGQPAPSGESGRSSLSYMPALDGLRALAVLAVLAYHADLPWARAGFLGVDVFFVISGFLITALLLNEHARNGRINLIQFWRRRALRLLPALLLLLAVVSVAVPLLAPDQNETLRGDVLAALTYVSNWWLIFQDQPYFEAIGRPPVLRHLWSLAVEEQFYLLWPLLLAFGLRNPFRSPRRLVKWLLLAVAASGLAMAFIYSPDGDNSRAYFGTDTRIGTILLGAALAFLWSPGVRSASPRKLTAFARDLFGLGALAGLGWLIFSWNEFEPMLYMGGFTLVAILSVVAVAVSSQPGYLTGRLLGNLPLRWLGQRSYSIYLWHWPVFMLTRPELDTTLSGLPLIGLRLGLTLSLAVASYALVEKPVRDGFLGHCWVRLRSGLSAPRALRPAISGFCGLMIPMLVGGAVLAGVAIPREAPRSDAELALEKAEQDDVSTVSGNLHPIEGVELTEPEEPAPPAEPPVDPNAVPVDPGAVPAPRVTAIGDSVMLIAKDALTARFGGVVDAGVGRQTKDVIAVTQHMRDTGQLGDAVILHMGTNGLITVAQFDQIMDLLKDVPLVAVVNVKVARPWEEVNNRMLAENVGRFPNTRLVDWKATGSANPHLFYSDGVHLKPSGIGTYVDMMSAALSG